MLGKLTELQARVLATLAPLQPAWTLTGGGALAGFHLRHRTTRDLDLFWHGLQVFTREPEDCERLLRHAGCVVEPVQRAPAFARLRVRQGDEVVLLDLVAEPVPTIERPETTAVLDTRIQIDSEHEIFTNKLGTLLHRAEIRDLVDLRALLARGADLARGLRDAARKDGGFSPLMLGHLLHAFPIEKLGAAAGLTPAETTEIAAFRDELGKRIAGLSLS